MKHIAVVCYGGGHVAMLLPVVKKLQERPFLRLTIIALTTARAVFERNGFSCLSYSDLVDLAPSGYLRYGEKLAARLASGPVPREETLAYLGINFQELVNVSGHDQAKQLYRDRARATFYPLGFMTNVLSSLQPDLLLTTNSPRSELAALHAARALAIPTVSIFEKKIGDWVQGEWYADTVCTENEAQKRELMDRGLAPGTIIVTGNPSLDALYSEPTRCDAKAMRERNFPGYDKFLLWASQTEPERSNGQLPYPGGATEFPGIIERKLVEFIDSHPRWLLIIRNHPSDFRAEEPLPVNAVRLKDDPIERLLYLADVVLTVNSTVGVQAAMIGKPVCSLEFSVRNEERSLADDGIATGIWRPEDISQVLERVLTADTLDRAPIPDAVADGEAANRVVAAIERLL